MSDEKRSTGDASSEQPSPQQHAGGNPPLKRPLDTGGSGKNPAHRLIMPEDLDPYERKVLESKLGYDGLKPVPSDLAKRMPEVDQRSKAAALDALVGEAASALPEGYRPPTEDLQAEFPEPVADDSPEAAAALAGFSPELLQAYSRANQSGMGSQTTQPEPAADRPPQATQPVARPSTPPPSPAGQGIPTPLGVQPKQQQAGANVVPQLGNKLDAVLDKAAEEAIDPYADLPPDIAAAKRDLDSEINMEPELSVDEDEASGRPEASEVKDKMKEADRRKRAQQTQWDYLRRSIPQEDQEAYRAALFHFAPFRKTYPFPGGTITFQELDHATKMAICHQSAIDVNADRHLENDNVGAMMDNQLLQIAGRVVHLQVGDSNPIIHIPPEQSVMDYLRDVINVNDPTFATECTKHDTNLRRWSVLVRKSVLRGAVYDYIYQLNEKFRELCTGLQVLSMSPDFFQAQS